MPRKPKQDATPEVAPVNRSKRFPSKAAFDAAKKKTLFLNHFGYRPKQETRRPGLRPNPV